jgi:transcriptional regulator GlxA family with amidase domain
LTSPGQNHMREHLIHNRLEDARDMMRYGDVHITEVARRLGVSVETLEKEFEREARKG